jgi:hypothetical protein
VLPVPWPGFTSTLRRPSLLDFSMETGVRHYPEIVTRLGLELVSRAGFGSTRQYKTSPVDLEWFRGQVWPKRSRKPDPSKRPRIPESTWKASAMPLRSSEGRVISKILPFRV